MQSTVIPVWPGAAPGSEDWTYPEREVYNPPDIRLVLNVTRPTLTVGLVSFRPILGQGFHPRGARCFRPRGATGFHPNWSMALV